MQSSKQGYYGHRRRARELNGLAAESMERMGRKERAVDEGMTAALGELAFGDMREACEAAISILSLPIVGEYAKEGGALIFAWVGDASRPESLVHNLAKGSPEATILQSVAVPTVRAEMELSKKRPARSVELLRATTPYELT